MRRPRRLPWLLLALPALLGAGPHEVVRLRVPEAKLGTFFPAGTELRGLPLAEFEALVRDARAGADRRRRPDGPRLLRARHSATWKDGLLVGRSELVVEGPADGPAPLWLDPWGPALDADQPAETRLRSAPDGRLALWVVAKGTVTRTLRWTLRGRADGQSFALALPRCDVSGLVLDLPARFVPEGPAGVRLGPAPGSEPDHRAWRFDGPDGAISLRFRTTDDASRRPELWVGGPTYLDVDEGSARWRAEWTVEPGPAAPRRLELRLDPGLDLVDAAGPGVVDFRTEPAEGGTRVVLRLADDLARPSPLTIRARAPVPAAGPWSVPSARPSGASWIGGTTLVRLGPGLVLDDCRDRDGRRVEPTAEDQAALPGPGTLLAFEAGAPGTPAVLTFRRPEADVVAEVRGWIGLGGEAPRLVARLTWRAQRGRLLAPAADLPSSWVIDRVDWGEVGGTPPSWRVEPRPDGIQRLSVQPPPRVEVGRPLTVTVAATAVAAPGSLRLPRIRLVGAQPSDELWSALADSGTTVRPVLARGLAWIDPALVGPAPAGLVGSSALAWRWNEPDGEARVEVGRGGDGPVAAVRQVVAIGAGRLAIDARIVLEPTDDSLRWLPVVSSLPLEPAPEWRASDDGAGPPLPVRSIDPGRRAVLGLPASGMAWEVELPRRARATAPVALRARWSRPWSGSGQVPLIALPERSHASGIVLLTAAPGLTIEAKATSLRVLDPALARRAIVEESAGTDPPFAPPAATRPGPAFGFEGPGGALSVRAEALRDSAAGGVIREAILTTRAPVAGAGPTRQQLALRLEPAGAPELAVTLPDGANIDRVQVDGREVTPTRKDRDGALGIPLPAASCTVRLDYEQETPPGRPSRPGPPTFSMPCLALSWEVLAPRGATLADPGPPLVAADPAPVTSWTTRLLGDWPRPRFAPRDRSAALAMLAELDARAAEGPGAPATLADLLTRWDAGRWPIVVDRAALMAVGVGPGARVEAVAADPSGEGPARASLAPLGLTIAPAGGAFLVTSRAELPAADAAEARSGAFRLAIGRGSDEADRYQSVPRWRGEPTPASPPVGAPPWGAGWDVRRFVAPGWTTPGPAPTIRDPASLAARGWGMTLAALIVGIAARRVRSSWRRAGVGLVLAGALLAIALRWPGPSPMAGGVFRGAIAAVAFWLGRALRPDRRATGRGRSSRPPSTQSRRSGFEVSLGLTIALGLGLVGGRLADGRPHEADDRIIALIPYDGPAPDPADPGSRVVLRLTDFERLRDLAGSPPPAPPLPLAATGASHRVEAARGGFVAVASRFELASEVEGPSSWHLPVGEAIDFSATLDGHDAPVFVAPGGHEASVSIAGKGTHALIIRRLVPLETIDGGLALRLPIDRVASATIEVAPDAGRGKGECPSARGDSAAGRLGPADLLEVIWSGAATDRPAAKGSVEGALLWDATPAGDRLRARLTFRRPGGTTEVRLALAPGLVVRSVGGPGLIDARTVGAADRAEWVARIDPPLPDGEAIILDLWRSRPAAAGPGRGCPRVEPLGSGPFAGVLGFRRPLDWWGRLGPIAGVGAIAEDEFVGTWGELPRDRLVLAGASRFLGAPAAEVAIGPLACRREVRPSVQVQVAAGRLNWRVDATLLVLEGRDYGLEVGIPDGLQVLRVEADGLTAWSRPEPGRLRLRFDGPGLARRAIRLDGWLAVATEPLSTAPARHELAVPWPNWEGVEVQPATLSIAAPVAFALAPRLGVAPVEPDDGAARGATAASRRLYRVVGPENPGRLSWSDEPAWLDVLTRSHLTVGPDAADWVATVRYQVARAPCGSIRLRLPNEWAGPARFEIEGGGELVSSQRGARMTTWNLRPDRPIWGTRRFVIRASRPLPRRGRLEVPQLDPLGWGSVETQIAVTNATGRGLSAETTTGLEPIPPSRFPAADRPTPATWPTTTYLVKQDDWSLRLAFEGPSPTAGPAGDGAATRATLADLSVVLADDGAAEGRAMFDLEARPGRALTIEFPEGSEVVAAEVDGRPVVTHRGPSGRWSVPLGEAGGVAPRQVVVLWRAGARSADPDGGRVVPLPGLPQRRLPTLVTVAAPPGWTVEPGVAPGAATPVAWAELDVERAERLARTVADEIDRGQPSRREAVVEGIVRFELQARVAERAAARGEPVERTARLAAAQGRWLDRLRSARSGLADALAAANLGDLIPIARSRVGLEARPGPAVATSLVPEPLRLRRLGQTTSFRADAIEPGRGPILRVSAPASPPGRDRLTPWLLAIVALGGVPSVLLLAARLPAVSPRLGPALLALTLTAALLLVQPFASLAALGLVAVGRFGGLQDRP
ncbi:MAG TPA: hypothetical protein VG406_25430 [Isosphaeraceae bacterium]|jgi:hypothetical protein|nr:hypothetical protein [Isosphaeraceae bacterium]